MKQLRQLCAATVLTLALTFSAFAGSMPGGFTALGSMPGGSPQATSETESTSAGETTTDDTLTEVVQNLLQDLLSLF